MANTNKNIFYIFLLLILSSCKQSKNTPSVLQEISDTSNRVQIEEDDIYEKYNYQDTTFELIANYPTIRDTITFIKELKANCHIWTRKAMQPFVTINYFKRTKIYGSKNFIYIIEYDYHDGSTSSFPYKNQYIFNSAGRLLGVLSMKRLDIVQIFPKNDPFLFGVSSTGHGNGGHSIYRARKDTLEQIYDGFIGNRPQTYDRNEDLALNVPNEFKYKIADLNNDGYNDITFSGKIKHSKIDLGVNEKLTPVKYVFLFNRDNGHFIEKEDYSKKYEFIYGNSK